MDKNEMLADILVGKVQHLPDPIKKAFLERAVKDAKQLIFGEEQLTVEKLSYTIYRAYALGAALFDGDKIIEEIDNVKVEKDNVDDSKKNDKVIHLDFNRKVSY